MKGVVSVLEPAQPSPTTEGNYVKAEDEQKMVHKSINTDELPLTTDLSAREDTKQLFIIHHINQ